MPETTNRDLDDVPAAGRHIALVAGTAGKHEWVIEAGQWPDAVAAYLASVNFVDAQMGRVLEALENSGKADNTIVVIWSDHGYHLGEKEHWGKFTGWDESTRVPLVILLPESMGRSEVAKAFPAGREYAGAVNLIDLYPTLVELAGLPLVEGLEGNSLVEKLESGAENLDATTLVTFGRGNYTVAQGSWRYIHYFDGTEELYDLTVDPNQYENLAGRTGHEDRLSAFRKELPETPEIAWIARWKHYKVVEFQDPHRAVLLFDQTVADAVTDRLNTADEHPEVVAKVRAYVKDHGEGRKYLALPDTVQ